MSKHPPKTTQVGVSRNAECVTCGESWSGGRASHDSARYHARKNPDHIVSLSFVRQVAYPGPAEGGDPSGYSVRGVGASGSE